MYSRRLNLNLNYPWKPTYSRWHIDRRPVAVAGLFAFVEEVSKTTLDDEEQVFEFVFSGVETPKFIEVEHEFEDFDPSNEDERKKRKQLLQKHFGERSNIWNIRLKLTGNDETEWLAVLFQPSSWHHLVLSRSHGARVEREEHGDAKSSLRLLEIGPVHPYFVSRLEEVFSLKHLIDEDFDEDNEGSSNPSPFTPSEELALDMSSLYATIFSYLQEEKEQHGNHTNSNQEMDGQ